jgi:hypothetical protein
MDTLALKSKSLVKPIRYYDMEGVEIQATMLEDVIAILIAEEKQVGVMMRCRDIKTLN